MKCTVVLYRVCASCSKLKVDLSRKTERALIPWAVGYKIRRAAVT